MNNYQPQGQFQPQGGYQPQQGGYQQQQGGYQQQGQNEGQMTGFNNLADIALIGNLATDPEDKQVNGKNLVTARIAVNHIGRSGEVDYWTLEAWEESNRMSYNAIKKLSKGKRIWVGGTPKLKTKKKDDGSYSSFPTVVTNRVIFLDTMDDNHQGGNQQNFAPQQQQQPNFTPPQQQQPNFAPPQQGGFQQQQQQPNFAPPQQGGMPPQPGQPQFGSPQQGGFQPPQQGGAPMGSPQGMPTFGAPQIPGQ